MTLEYDYDTDSLKNKLGLFEVEGNDDFDENEEHLESEDNGEELEESSFESDDDGGEFLKEGVGYLTESEQIYTTFIAYSFQDSTDSTTADGDDTLPVEETSYLFPLDQLIEADSSDEIDGSDGDSIVGESEAHLESDDSGEEVEESYFQSDDDSGEFIKEDSGSMTEAEQIYTTLIADNLQDSTDTILAESDDTLTADETPYLYTLDLNGDGFNNDWIKRTDEDLLDFGGENLDEGSHHGHINGGDNDDKLLDDSGSNLVTCGLGDDRIDGNAGDDQYVGGLGDDTVRYASATAGIQVNLGEGRAHSIDREHDSGIGHDKLKSIENVTGSDFDDSLIGNARSNRLEGGNGDDELTGGRGADILVGGLGNDIFEYRKVKDVGLNKTSDTIEDFTSGEDTIDLSAIDAQRGHTRNDAFNFLESAPDSGTSANGAVWFDEETSTLYGSTDADSSAEFAIILTGVTTLTASDIVL